MLSDFAIFGLGPIFSLLIILIVIAVFVFEVRMIIDVVKNHHLSDDAKVLWLLGMFFVHPFVALAYYFTSYRKNK